MKPYSLWLLLNVCILSTCTVVAMRRGPSLYHHTLRTRQYFLLKQLRQQKAQRALSGITCYDWIKSHCYQQLKDQPTTLETHNLINQQSSEAKQLLLETAVQDYTIHPRVLVTLLEAGADINKPDKSGQTPLHKLAKSSQSDNSDLRIQILLAYIAHYKPNFELKDQQGNRPRDLAHGEFSNWFEEHEPICWSRLREMYRHY